MRAAGWEFSDAWVLAAVLSNADSCTLGELVAAGDGINHADGDRATFRWSAAP